MIPILSATGDHSFASEGEQVRNEQYRSLWALTAIMLLLSCNVSAQDDLSQRITDFVQTNMAEHEVMGTVLAVVTDDEVIYNRGFGVKNMYTMEPETSQSLFHMASVTKTFVAAALMPLHEKGLLDVDAPG